MWLPLTIDELTTATNEIERLSAAHGLVRSEGFWIRKGMERSDLEVIHDIFHNDAYRLCFRHEVRSARLVVDVGAHIGSFATLFHRANPEAQIVCVEACPENIAPLRANVGHFARIVHAACTYEKRPLVLLNSVTAANVASTGGSIVMLAGDEGTPDDRYRVDHRPLSSVTLESLLERSGSEMIDVLKLDCEGSEYSILPNADLSRIRLIVGEYHGFERWERMRTTLFSGWDYGHMLSGEFGIFHLVNPEHAQK